MKPQTRYGFIFGLVGLFLNICVAAAVGICGPFVSLLAGTGAGFFAVQNSEGMVKGDGAKTGAMSGAIAGAVVIVGQLIGGIIALTFIQSSDTGTIFGSAPAAAAGTASQIAYYGGGLAVGLCFGLIGVGLAALGGAVGGYLGTRSQAGGPRIIDGG